MLKDEFDPLSGFGLATSETGGAVPTFETTGVAGGAADGWCGYDGSPLRLMAWELTATAVHIVSQMMHSRPRTESAAAVAARRSRATPKWCTPAYMFISPPLQVVHSCLYVYIATPPSGVLLPICLYRHPSKWCTPAYMFRADQSCCGLCLCWRTNPEPPLGAKLGGGETRCPSLRFCCHSVKD